MVSVDEVSHGKFKSLSNLFKEGDTVYGRVFDRMIRESRPSSSPASPGNFYMSIKLVDDPKRPWVLGSNKGSILKKAEQMSYMTHLARLRESGKVRGRADALCPRLDPSAALTRSPSPRSIPAMR